MRPFPSRVLLPAACLLAACAGQGTTVRTDVGTVSDERGNIIHTTSSLDARIDSVAMKPQAAFAAVTNAYVALGLTPNVIDQASATVGVRNVPLMRKLGEVQLTRYVDCGTDNMLGTPLASNNRVELTMVTDVKPAGEGSRLSTVLTGRVIRTSSGASSNAQTCSTTGVLEKLLLQKVRERAP